MEELTGMLEIRLHVLLMNKEATKRDSIKRVTLYKCYAVTRERAKEIYKQFKENNPTLATGPIYALWTAMKEL